LIFLSAVDSLTLLKPYSTRHNMFDVTLTDNIQCQCQSQFVVNDKGKMSKLAINVYITWRIPYSCFLMKNS